MSVKGKPFTFLEAELLGAGNTQKPKTQLLDYLCMLLLPTIHWIRSKFFG